MKKEAKGTKGDSKVKKTRVTLFDDHKTEEDEEDGIDTGTYFTEMLKTIVIILIAGIGTYAVIRAAYSIEGLRYIFYPFQYAELYSTYYISKLFGVDVSISATNDFTLIYRFPDDRPNEYIQIVSACTAVCEMGMIMAVILAFRGPRIRKRLLWAGIFAAFLFVENIIRLVMNYPLFLYLDTEGWVKYHNLWMEYGQLLVVMILLVI